MQLPFIPLWKNREHWAQGDYEFRSSISIQSSGITFYKVLQQTQSITKIERSFLPDQHLGHLAVMGKVSSATVCQSACNRGDRMTDDLRQAGEDKVRTRHAWAV